MRRRLTVCVALGVLSVALGCSAPLTSTNTAPLRTGDVRAGTRYSLPLRVLRIQVWHATVPGMGERDYAVLAGTHYVPDPRAQYLLTYHESPLSHDTIAWEVEDGFLKQVKAKTKDESLAAVASAVGLFVEVAKASVAFGGSGLVTPRARVQDMRLVAQYVVDPLSPRGRDQLREIQDAHEIAIDMKPVNDCPLEPEQPSCVPLAPQCIPGIAYRAEYPYVLSMRPMGIVSPDAKTHEVLHHAEQVLLMPNRSPVTLMPLSRAAFVDKRMDLTFTNGVLTKVEVDKPSALKGFFDSLLEPVRAIASLPGELLQLRITQVSSETSLVQNEAALLEAMQSYLQTLDEYREFMQQRGDPGGPAPGNAPLPGGLGN